MPESVMDISAALNDAANASLAGLVPDEATAPPESDPAEPSEEVAAVSASPAEPTPDAPVDATLPEGYVAIPTIGADAVSTFAIYDSGGEIEIPAFEVEYKANGKVRRDRLDQVVKLAQMGVYNHARDTAREETSAAQLQEAQQLVAMREEQLQRLLEDENLYLQARDRYSEANTPEVRAQRLAAENEQLRTERVTAATQVKAEQFYNGEILPAMQAIVTALPEVSEDELGAYLAAATIPLLRNGQVPPEQYDTLRHYIVNELTPWAQKMHATRSAKIHQANAAAGKKVEAAQVSAQKAKREVGKMLKPGARTLSGVSEVKKSKAPATIDDAVESAMSEVLAGYR